MDLHDWCEHIMTGVCILLGNASNLPLSQSFELNRVLSVLHIILYIAVILLSLYKIFSDILQMTQLHYAGKYLIVTKKPPPPQAINKPAFERYSEQVNPCSLLRSRVTAPQNVCGRPQQLIAVCESSVSVCKHTSLGKQCIHCVCVLVL